MVILDVSIVNIALPSAQRDLGFSTDQRQWVVTAYALAFGSLLLLGGRIADLFGRKRTLLVGLAGFAAASAVGGAATSFGMLVVARAAQGLFGALLAPAVLSLLTTTFTEPRERARAFGIYGAIAGTGGAVGLLLGGLLTEYLDWRWCMYVNLIFAVVALAGGTALLHHTPSDERPKLDLLGTITVSAGLFSLVYGFANAETHSWSAPGTWAFLLAGVVLVAVFVALQTRVAHPLLPMRVLIDRNRAGSYLTVFMAGVGMFGIFLFLTYYLQQNLGFSPVSTGLAFLPMVGGAMITSTIASSLLLPRVGPRPLISLGMLAAAGGMLWLTALNVHSTYATDILSPLVIMGLGMGLSMAPAMSTATSGIEPHDAGVASATANVGQQVGGSIGTALLSTIAASATSSYLHGKTPTAEVLAHAAVHSYTTAFAWAAAIFAAGAIICGLLVRPGVPKTGAAAAVHM
ncbi:major facilitator superfamily transporter [Candidatus Protofrankia californiensis]|uniref:Major facilitator superfamily transporter n=2 Tax=Protofrankia TaxID=2994361 RepID=A0A1C3P1L6_9ACTN|nr:major facilitator superfamily transporter [Candidatus Protofrankia californiensis]